MTFKLSNCIYFVKLFTKLDSAALLPNNGKLITVLKFKSATKIKKRQKEDKTNTFHKYIVYLTHVFYNFLNKIQDFILLSIRLVSVT